MEKSEEGETRDQESWESKVKELEAQAGKNYDLYLRAAADLENAQRRFTRERSDFIKYALEEIMRDFLPVLDSLDLALESKASASQEEALTQGVVLVRKQLWDLLSRRGLEALDPRGSSFDPECHEALHKQICSEEEDHEKILQVFVKGYRLHGRLLRPAKVSVGIRGAKDEQKAET